MLNDLNQQLEEYKLLLLAGVAIIVLAVAGFYGYRHFSQSADAMRKKEDAAAVAALADQVGKAITGFAAPLYTAAQNPALSGALIGADKATLEARAQEIFNQLSGQVSGLLKVRLLPQGLTETDNTTTPPLTYASIDMLRAAEISNQPVPTEVHLFGTPAQHWVVMAPVNGTDGKLLVALHAAIKVEGLNTVLSGVPAGGAVLQLRQPAAKPLQLASNANVPTDAEPALAPVPGTKFELAYWRGADAAPAASTGAETVTAAPVATRSNPLPLIGGGILALLAAAGGAFFLMRRRPVSAGGTPASGSWLPAMAQDEYSSIVYHGAVESIMQGAHPGVERWIPSLSALGPRAGGGATTAAGAASRAKVSARAAADEDGDDITAFAKPAPKIRVPSAAEAAAAAAAMMQEEKPGEADAPPASVFRAYDIRGIVGETLKQEHLYKLGLSIGTDAELREQQTLVVGYDGRASSEPFAQELMRGLKDAGRDVIDVGMVPTPVLYYAAYYLDTLSGVMITGSHNPGNYNGLKILLGGEALYGDAVMSLRRRIVNDEMSAGNGEIQSAEIIPDYIQRISEDIPVAFGRHFKVVMDCGNGVAGAVAPRLLRALGHEVIELYCNVDGNFPNHHPDPSQPDNLQDLIARVQAEGADLGLAFDGDGDRLGVVAPSGRIVWPDQQMILFARDVLSRNPGAPIIFDVKCSRHLREAIKQAGGTPVMMQTGHSLIKAKLRELNAPLAGEMSGHIFFQERWYGFDDAMYAAARLLEILLNDPRTPEEVFASIPTGVTTPELRLEMPETQHADFMQKLIAAAKFDGAEISTLDGLRVDFAKAWGLIRPSNTTPCLILRFEGNDETMLQGIQQRFRALINKIDPTLKLPF